MILNLYSILQNDGKGATSADKEILLSFGTFNLINFSKFLTIFKQNDIEYDF